MIMYWILYKHKDNTHWRIYVKKNGDQEYRTRVMANHTLRLLKNIRTWDDAEFKIVSEIE